MREPRKIIHLTDHKEERNREYTEFIYDAEPGRVAGVIGWLADSTPKAASAIALAVGWVAFNVCAGGLELALIGGHLLRRELADFAQAMGRPSLGPWLQKPSGGVTQKRLTDGSE